MVRYTKLLKIVRYKVGSVKDKPSEEEYEPENKVYKKVIIQNFCYNTKKGG